MKALIPVLALLAACTPAQVHSRPDPRSLRGVTLGLPVPADARPTPGIGCGQLSQDLPLRAHKALVAAFSDAGASVSNSDREPWVLTVALREATMGEENVRTRRTDRPPASPVQPTGPDAPPLDQPQASIVNSGNATAVVVLDATLARGGTVTWTGTVAGHARSAPCVQAIDKVREALLDAIDQLRDRVIALRTP
ncbi:MAG: hypothetical protein E6J63_10185 [Deltaproteobacteria bacterium]|nr:MAG: hypothetical protein E6J63_10185 [Deltaproteobacteria bacterium]